MKDDTIICRCEDVTWGEIRQALEKGYTSLDEIKRITSVTSHFIRRIESF